MALAAGTRLGVYEIMTAIGTGGMGEVYRARDPRLGREVAIKVLSTRLPSISSSTHAPSAGRISQLDHKPICALYYEILAART
jgi:serine/threonine protein kinase